MGERSRLPTLSNDAQLAIMNMVKGGMSLDNALKKAQELEAEEVRKGEMVREEMRGYSLQFQQNNKMERVCDGWFAMDKSGAAR